MANEHVGRSRILHLVGNSHIDPVWLWQWPEGFQEIRATFRSALDRMTEDPDFIFTCDSAAYYAWIEEIEPAMFEEIRARVAEGRWELVGGWWVEPDCNIPSGESFVRQALISQLFFLDRFGKTATVGYNVDPFGHNAMLPQLLRGAGMDSYVFMRPGPHEAPLPGPLFRWESPDGSTVLAYRLPHEYCAPSEDLGYHLDKSIAQLPPGWSQMMAFYGVGNHGGGPTRANLESIRRLDGAGSMPRLIHSTPRRFFDSVDEEANIPVVVGDLQHHAIGCYSAHSGIKSWMRRAENGLVSAEAWAAVGRIAAGRPYPRDELDRAWQGVLFNQFHDTLGGTAIEPAYDDAHDQLGEASAIAARVQNIAIQSLSQLIDIGDEPGVVPIVVFNPLAWPVQAEVELEYGGLKPAAALVDELGKDVTFQSVQSYATVSSWRSRLAFETQLPALGYRTLFMRPDHPRPTLSGLSVSGTTIETPQLRVGVDPTSGRIDQLVLREHGQDVVDLADPSRGRAVVMADTSDTWGHR
ncbi:MAG: alpha-mannosidase, partial [Chloroflexota bacterium]